MYNTVMDIWEADRAHIQAEAGAEITRRKIRKISFTHKGKVLVAEVGKPDPYNNVTVRAIYEDGKRGIYLICAGTVTIAPKTSLVEDE
jgi:hypothetical protein